MLTRNLVLEISRQLTVDTFQYIIYRTKLETKFFVFSSDRFRFGLTKISVIALVEFGSVSVRSVNRKLTEMSVNLTALASKYK